MMTLKAETVEKYAELEELVSFCENNLIQGSTIEGEFLSSQIDKLNHTATELGDLCDGTIIPLARECKCV